MIRFIAPAACRLLCLGLLLAWGCSPQGPASPPWYWRHAATLYPCRVTYPLKAPHNRPEIIQAELLDRNTIRLVGKFSGLSDGDLGAIRVAREARAGKVGLYHFGFPRMAVNRLTAQLGAYTSARQNGHTRQFLLAAMTDRSRASQSSDPAVRAIAAGQPFFPVSWLKLEKSGAITNRAENTASLPARASDVNGRSVPNESTPVAKRDVVRRWRSYTLADGEIAWRYAVRFGATGGIEFVHESRFDAKDLDPRYHKFLHDAAAQARSEMKRAGTAGQLGSVHTFWNLKQNYLKAKGIAWRTPAELNPNACYD